MAKDIELDLEVLEAGSAYMMYTVALVGVAIAKNEDRDPSSAVDDVRKFAKRLQETLLRCGVDKEIPVGIGTADEILRFLQGCELILEISNLLFRQHSHRQEYIFILLSLMGGVISGSSAGVSAATGTAREQAIAVAELIGIPRSIIEECFIGSTLDPLREFLRNPTNRSTLRPTGTRARVFLVHGHDEAVLHRVARFIERLELETVVLREQPNSGRAIIEKFIEYSDVDFAVVLLTGDDRGGTKDANHDQQSPRARQNVVFELGFFIGKLGRTHVCALCEDGVEIPSDYSGVLYVPIDQAGAWQIALATEMHAAGVPVDMNFIVSAGHQLTQR